MRSQDKDFKKEIRFRKVKIFFAQVISLVGLFLIFSNIKTFWKYIKNVHISFGGEKTHASSLLKKKPLPEKTIIIDSEKEVRLIQKAKENYELIKVREEKIKKKEMSFKKITKVLDQKIAQLEKIKLEINKSLELIDVQQQKKLTHLIKIIESMKSKNAAAIFNDLPLESSIHLALHMSEKKLSDIFTNMKVEKAKALTLALLEQKNPYAKEG